MKKAVGDLHNLEKRTDQGRWVNRVLIIVTLWKFIDRQVSDINRVSGGKVSVQGIFRVSRAGEAEQFGNCGVPGNHRLLWHGTKTANMMGILQQGLRIAPPDASRTGWSLGKVSEQIKKPYNRR